MPLGETIILLGQDGEVNRMPASDLGEGNLVSYSALCNLRESHVGPYSSLSVEILLKKGWHVVPTILPLI